MSASDRQSAPRRRSAGFTLVEVMVAMTLLFILSAAVLSSFVFMLRAEQSLTNYNLMNAQARSVLEQFGTDAKSASDVTNFTASSITMSVPLNTTGTTNDVTYAYNSGAGTITRTVGAASATLVTNINTFTFRYLNSLNIVTTSLAELKQVQLSMLLVRTVESAKTSQYVISAQFTLRAKPVSH